VQTCGGQRFSAPTPRGFLKLPAKNVTRRFPKTETSHEADGQVPVLTDQRASVACKSDKSRIQLRAPKLEKTKSKATANIWLPSIASTRALTPLARATPNHRGRDVQREYLAAQLREVKRIFSGSTSEIENAISAPDQGIDMTPHGVPAAIGRPANWSKLRHIAPRAGRSTRRHDPTQRGDSRSCLHLVTYELKGMPRRVNRRSVGFRRHLAAQQVIRAAVEATRMPAGKCTNISCMLRGSQEVVDHVEKKLGIKTGESTPDGRIYLKREEECLAACTGAPMMMVDHVFHENLNVESIDKILDELT